MFAIKQEERKFYEADEKPAFIHRADKSPNFGVRVFEPVGVFATMADAKVWVAAQK
jgi:hypothetical protein